MIWTGMPLWFLQGFVDDADQHSNNAYNQALAEAGYDIILTASDGVSKTFSSTDTIRSTDYIVANTLNGYHIPGSDSSWPLRLVGNNVSKSDNVKGIVAITLNYPPIPASITVPPLVDKGSEVSASGTFTEADMDNVHTVKWNWGDGSKSDGTINETEKSVAGSHVYTIPGLYTVNFTVTDGPGSARTSDSAMITVTSSTGSINVTSKPAGAKIYLDGEETTHVTPYILTNVPVGDHDVNVTLAGYISPTTKIVTVIRDETAIAEFTLLEEYGQLEVTSTPVGAKIYIDDADTSEVTPYTFDKAPGDYQVNVSLSGYYIPNAVTATVTSGQKITKNFELVAIPPADGQLEVTSTPVGAKIFIDGTDTLHITPYTFDKAPGDYQVNVSLSGYYIPDAVTATVTSGQKITKNFELVAIPPADGQLEVTSTPVGAKIYIDDADTGEVTPYTFDKAPGDYQVNVSLSGYYIPDAVTATVTSGQKITKNFELVAIPPADGQLEVTSTPVEPRSTLMMQIPGRSRHIPLIRHREIIRSMCLLAGITYRTQ